VPGTYSVALTGDVIMNTPVSVCRDPDVLAAVEVLRAADVTHAHLEIPLHDFDRADIFGAAEGALSWMRGPARIADELRWLGVDVVSAASNHSLDYSYGGLQRTIEALDAVGLPHAGIGADLGAARSPAFADTAVGRFAVVSATSAFPAFARAGATRPDAAGRPGVNPLRYLHAVSPAVADQIRTIAGGLGMWVVSDGDEFVVHPPGLHNSITRFLVVPGISECSTRCNADDLNGIAESIRLAAATADLVVGHLHVQAWDGADGRMSSSPSFVSEFADAAIQAGARIVLVQGSHAPMRGIEIRCGVPVFYDPGPLFRLGRREAQPHDFYLRWGNTGAVRSLDAGPLDAFGERDHALGGVGSRKTVHSPREGNGHEPGFVVPVCIVDAAAHHVVRVELHPMYWSSASKATTGFPVRARGPHAQAILSHLGALSVPYGTLVSVDADQERGVIVL
jgi:hypothetical protein